MPWSFPSECNIEKYQEILTEFFTIRRKSLDLIIKDQLVRGNLLKYDFTKRQLNIIIFIILFSYNLCKEWAYIPRLSDFEVAGISKFKVRQELNKLIEMDVIETDEENKIYRIKEPKYWKVSLNMGYKAQRSRELFLLNLKHDGFDTTSIEKKIDEMER